MNITLNRKIRLCTRVMDRQTVYTKKAVKRGAVALARVSATNAAHVHNLRAEYLRQRFATLA